MSESTGIGASDRIVLTLPTSSGLRGVATLVLGGIGTRLDLPYERVDDLQLAVLSVLAAAADDEDTLTIDVACDDEQVEVALGPLHDGASADPGLHRVLERLVDAVEPLERESREWITLRLWRAPADG